MTFRNVFTTNFDNFGVGLLASSWRTPGQIMLSLTWELAFWYGEMQLVFRSDK